MSRKIALITGASRGIGQAIALQLARQGLFCIGTATTPQGAQAITQVFQEQQLTGVGIELDVCQIDAMIEIYNQLTAQYGAIDVLVNNAAVTRDGLLIRMKAQDWAATMQTNCTAVFHLTQLCLKHMMRQRWGRIVNISSVVGVMGNAGQCNYAAAKAAVIGFSKSLAQEVASRAITVNAVAPGFIDTDMTKQLSEKQKELILGKIPMGRLGAVEDVANMVGFLVSEKSQYITGQTFHVNGGMYMN